MRPGRSPPARTGARACATVLAAAAIGWSTGAAAEGLLDAVHAVLASEPRLESARIGTDISREGLAQARSGLLPRLTASVGEAAERLDFRSDAIDYPSFQRTFNAWGPSLHLALPLYDATLWDAFDAAQLRVQLIEAQLDETRAGLLLRTAEAYFSVLAGDDALTALGENRQAVAHQLEQVHREFEAGTKTVVDTHEALARSDQLAARELLAQQELSVRRDALGALLGRTPGALRALRDPLPLAAPQPAHLDDWLARAASDNPGVVSAQAAQRLAQGEDQRTRDAGLPTLHVTGDLQYQRADNGSLYIPTQNSTTRSALGVVLSVPVYTGGEIRSRQREAAGRRLQADANLEAARRAALQRAREAYAGVDIGLARVRMLEASVRSAQTQLESTELGFRVGVRTTLDVLNAQAQQLDARRELRQARYDFLLNGLRLKAAAGALHEDDVAEVDSLLVP